MVVNTFTVVLIIPSENVQENDWSCISREILELFQHT